MFKRCFKRKFQAAFITAFFILMELALVVLALDLAGLPAMAHAKVPVTQTTAPLLHDIESKYRNAQSVQMDVDKTITLKLIEREKHSQGTIQIKHGGRLRWETTTPEKSLVIASGSTIWLVSYPPDDDGKPSIIKASNPKKSQPQAVVAFLMGRGHISDNFSLIATKHDEKTNLEKLELKPREDMEQIAWLTLYVNDKTKTIEQVSFEDNLGNVTRLEFKNIQFDKDVDSKLFQFKPPKGSDVTVLQ